MLRCRGMLDFKKIEEEVLEFWEKEKIYEKVKKRGEGKKKFYFLQGPPYTSGKIHIGQAWNNSLKDMIMRHKRMRGFDVWDRGGYDMHGLPTENAVQKKLGLKTKEEIEEMGVDKFVKECISFSNEYSGYMNEDLWKIGVWMDHRGAYKPITKDYIGGEWAFFKAAWEQGRLYKGKKVMHWDAETETSLAKHELEYKEIKDTSIFLKFKRKDADEYFLIWTTTPWTIPYNLAIMVNPGLDYVRIKNEDGENWIVAKALVSGLMNMIVGKKYEVLETFKGKKLDGIEYEHFLRDEINYKKMKADWPRVHTVLLSKEYVDISAGTGLVHCAPGCGPEDQEVGKKYGIDAFNTLNEMGEFENVGKFTGWVAKKDDDKFIEEFKERGVLLGTTEVEHEYPHSWRSHQPVVFRTTEQWFLRTEDLIKTLLKYNKKVSWVPAMSGKNYDRWAENLKDNGVTRQRFWGCPVPIWVNVLKPEDYFVVGSVEELEELTGKKFNDLNLHKPWIDEIVIEKDGNKYERIEDVADVWIDSGTASWNCLYNQEDLIKRYFPADLVLEATEQTRLWFSLLQICSAVMFGKGCYKNVYTHGMILDFQGTKMSKSLGNIISPYEVIDKYSADIMRNYLIGQTAGENMNFSWEDIKVKQRNLIMFGNIANYILDLEGLGLKRGEAGKEEKWILSKYNSTLKKVTKLLDEYRLDEVVREIEELYISLSRDYIKLVRDKANENSAVLETVKKVYLGVLKMFSIVCPFISEHLFRKLGQREKSVHLCKWEKYDEKKIDSGLEEKFRAMFEVIEKGLGVRDKEQIGLRWPLAGARVNCDSDLSGVEEIIARQLNVKRVELDSGKGVMVKLNLETTLELEAEGFARELARKVQAERKKAGLKKGEMIELKVRVNSDVAEMLETHLECLKERTNSSSLEFVDDKTSSKSRISFDIRGKKFDVFFS
jgi:isoleucyl-tRNA synthetase